MGCLGNLIWLLCGGLIGSIAFLVIGLVYCITIIGIPIGLQCFKLAYLTLWPFGKEVVYDESVGSFVVNFIWIIFGGLEVALFFATVGVILCITIVGIPFGLQFLKLAKLSLFPFGAEINN